MSRDLENDRESVKHEKTSTHFGSFGQLLRPTSGVDVERQEQTARLLSQGFNSTCTGPCDPALSASKAHRR